MPATTTASTTELPIDLSDDAGSPTSGYLTKLLEFAIPTYLGLLVVRFLIHATAGVFAQEGPFGFPYLPLAAATVALPLTLGAAREWLGLERRSSLLLAMAGLGVAEMLFFMPGSVWWAAYAAVGALTYPYGGPRRGASTWLVPRERPVFVASALLVVFSLGERLAGDGASGDVVSALIVTAPNTLLFVASGVLWARCCVGFAEDNLGGARA